MLSDQKNGLAATPNVHEDTQMLFLFQLRSTIKILINEFI